MPHIPDSRHADHDPLLVAAYAAGDATGSALDEAIATVAACTECAALHHDLRAISAALPTLPAPVRRRDFRLTPEQAATLRPAGWRRLLAPLAGPRFAFAGPLGTGLATLGIAGLLVAGSIGAPIAATAPQDGGGNAGVTTEAAASEPAAPDAAASGAPALEAPAEAAPLEAAPAGSPRDTVMKTEDAASAGTEAAPAEGAVPADAGVSGGEAYGAAGAEQAQEPPATVEAEAAMPGAAEAGFGVVLPVLSGLALVAGLLVAGLRLASRRLTART